MTIRIANGRSRQPENTQLPVLIRERQVLNSEVYDAAVRHLLAKHPLATIPLANMDLHLKRDPEDSDETLSIWDGRDMRLLKSPETRNYPALRLLYEIEEPPLVVRWHLGER